MADYYIYKMLTSEPQDMLDGPRIVKIDKPICTLHHPINIGEGPFKNLNDLKRNSIIYNELIKSDRRRADKIVLERFIIKPDEMPISSKDSDLEYKKVRYRLMQHTKFGRITCKGVSGLHFFDPERIQIIDLTGKENKLGVFKAKIQVFNERTKKWIIKETETTFFPRGWNLQKLIDECMEAFKHRKKLSDTKYYRITLSGIKVIFQYSKNGEFRSVFPIYE